METRKRKCGFTLIEVMLVLVILGGLAALAVFAFGDREKQANIRMTRIRMDNLLKYLDEYKMNVKQYPTEDQGLEVLVTKPDFETEARGENWCKLAKLSELKDGWKNKFRYKLGEDGKPRIISNGPDGEPDSDDDITRPVPEEEQ